MVKMNYKIWCKCSPCDLYRLNLKSSLAYKTEI